MADGPAYGSPTLVSLLICDQVIDDKLTNKKSAIGLFNTILTASLPAKVQQLVVLASLTDINTRTPLELRLNRDSDNTVLFSTRGSVEAPNPLAIVDLVFNLQGLILPAAGQYAFELYAGAELLNRRRFHVICRPPPPQQRTPTEPPADGG
jgi:hypothetical protein